MKKTLKLVPAIAMLLISAIMLSTATFAWFSMNNRVTVTGMTLKTKVSSNLLISADTTESNFTTSITQSRQALLEPASTHNGTTFFYTVDALANGASANSTWTAYNEGTALTDEDTFANKANYDPAFNSKYAIASPNPGTAAAYANAYAYVDYDFYLKATSTEDGQNLALTFCNLLYAGEPIIDRAFRVAVFAEEQEDPESFTGTQTLKTILAPNGAVYQDPSKGVSATDTRTAVSNYGTAATIATLDQGDVKYYSVKVRVWLEGEDTSCTNSTFVELTGNYTLALDFILGDDAGLTEIKSASGQASATVTANVATATLNTSETTSIAYKWYDSSDNEISTGSGFNTAEYTAAAAMTGIYCKVTTGSGQSYTTNPVNVTAP